MCERAFPGSPGLKDQRALEKGHDDWLGTGSPGGVGEPAVWRGQFGRSTAASPHGVPVLPGSEPMEPSSAPQPALGWIGGPSSELMPPGAGGNHFEMKVMIQLVVIHQVQLSFLGLGSREAE